ncbi:MAG TPA: TetR/AcrR family transcriptional regulator [Acidimicrobiales bacterium]|nr:TetR/AcrR family transcriptional regulator [Acidimicrobiales bacterium]
MAGDRRRQLVDTGIELVMRQRFQDALASVDTRSITVAAGVTTGSFFHHFANRGQFADAVAGRFEEMWRAAVDAFVAELEATATEEGVDVRALVRRRDWEKIEAQEVQGYLFHLLWVARHRPVSEDEGDTGADVLQRSYEYLLESVVPAYRRMVVAMGREMMPPFDEHDLAVTMNALVDGIQMCQRVDPQLVRDGLFADLVASTFVALTRPRGEPAAGVDLAALEAKLVPSSHRRRSTGERETWRQIAAAAAPLFDDRAVADVKVSDIADAAGVSTSTVYHQFGRVTAVAACGWAQYLPELEAIATRPITADEGPIVRMEQVLGRFVELGIEHRGALEGLMAEVLHDARREGEDEVAARLLTTVPLAELLIPHIRELRTRGWLRRRVGSHGLARTALQIVAMRTLATPHDPVERIIDDTFGLVLEGALTGGAGR